MPKIRASDARSWTACARRAWYDHYPPPGWTRPKPEEFDRLTAESGIEHEKSVLKRIEAQHPVVTAGSAEHTAELMRLGVPVIYQPMLDGDGLSERPDFLIRLPSGLYEPADAKLKRRIDRTQKDDQPVVVEIGVYRMLLKNSVPGRVFLGNGDEAEFGPEVDDLTEDFVASMRLQLSFDTPPPARTPPPSAARVPIATFAYLSFRPLAISLCSQV